ncbi:carbohydrate ABC transporter permease, partial [Candidatus Bathyarchaeota archaeon]
MQRGSLIIHVILIIVSIFFISPIIWLSWSSLKSAVELFSNPWPPMYPRFYNFVKAFFMMNYLRSIVNSVIITV